MFQSLLKPRFLKNYLSTMLFIVWGWYICFHVSSWHQGMLGNSLRMPIFNSTRDFLVENLIGPFHDWIVSAVPASLLNHIPDPLAGIITDAALGQTVTLTAPFLFKILVLVYAVLLVRFYLKYPWLHAKAMIFVRGLWLGLSRDPEKVRYGKKKRQFAPKTKISKQTKQAGLALLLKFFFAPLMINWCLGHVADMANSSSNVWIDGIIGNMSGRILFDQHLFWALFQAILFIDTLLFTLGYIIETPALKNRIVSVEPTFLGWFFCLACYPKFNEATSLFLDWNSTDFPSFDNDTIHLLMNCSILLLMGIYSWASVALGFRASNLTNRGIVTTGPYRFIRHPAYVAKNTAWWIGSIPFIYLGFSHSFKEGMWVLFCRCAWSFIYAMRAITEERHLRLANNGYDEYARKVRWRFIPGLI
ncbi:isoprenylcysteine carboxylmethyltransferase family protein [Uliginosibacterium sp. 31-16]|uniref:methyltransferase family protein n=1 Tax=Uliginosibacterium sp. 31-16 TaxID=3068315 RepID=UPI002740271C|nr:isoprenylcysteine carboxylmethyltransferase family protein [Uliginosibacterium sp. 31-16]MDP5241426.1 isoprenylcysteine carboxylmethyltransferase family protein [Uliginosibacterium sp. 31-16]